MNRHAELLFSALIPPDPPAVLRRRVLVAARAALGGGRRATDVWDRLWTSRPARFAWAAAVVGLAIGHLAISGGVTRPPAETAVPVTTIAVNHSELAVVADVGRLTAELPGWEIASARNGEQIGKKESL